MNDLAVKLNNIAKQYKELLDKYCITNELNKENLYYSPTHLNQKQLINIILKYRYMSYA